MLADLLSLLWAPLLMCLVLTGIHAYLGIHVIAREVRPAEVVPAVHAQVAIAREQRGVGQGRGGIERVRTRMAARGDDGMQFDDALFAREPADAAVHLQAGVAQRPGDRAAHIKASGVLPAHPVEYAPMRIQ